MESQHSRTHNPVFGLLTAWGMASVLVFSQIPAIGSEQVIGLKLIDGRPCATSTIRYGDKSLPANIVIDLGLSVPLIVHAKTAKSLGIEPNTGIELRFKDVTFRNVPVVAAEVSALDSLTRDHASELGEIPAVAILGLPTFAEHVLQVEIGKGLLRLLTPDEGLRLLGTSPGQEVEKNPTAWTAAYTEEGQGYWLAGVGPGHYALRVLFRTVDYDARIDATTSDLAGGPGGAIDDLRIGKLNIASYVAFRPENLAQYSKPRPDLIIGTNLLRHFRLILDPKGRRIRFEQVLKPEFPLEERSYFVAMTEEDADAVETFLKLHTTSRLAAEASQKLMEFRLKEVPANEEAIKRAIRFRGERVNEPGRANVLIALADQLLGSDRSDRDVLAREALAVASIYAPQSLDATASYHVQARLGRIAYVQNDLTQARRHLLSAAFGIPRDAMANLWMGELYERQGKLTRAWSRYLQAAIAREAPPGALLGLDRLNRNPTFRASFTMTDAEQLLEGRTVEFHPSERYAQEQSDHPNPVRLIELFTSVDHPQTQAAELAFAAMGEYFDGANVALIEYHVPWPTVDPLAAPISKARATLYGIKNTPAALFDGGITLNNGGANRDAAEVFRAYRTAALQSQPVQGSWEIGGRFVFDGARLSGQVEWTGTLSQESLRLHVIACEKAVMAPGRNGLVLHRYVARRSLSPSDGFGLFASTEPRSYNITLDVTQLTAELETTLTAAEREGATRFLIRPTYVDPAALDVVAFVQDHRTRKVLAARRFEPLGKDGRGS